MINKDNGFDLNIRWRFPDGRKRVENNNQAEKGCENMKYNFTFSRNKYMFLP